MKKIFAFIVVSLIAQAGFAQYENYLEVSREVMKTEKKAIIAEVMQLSDTEAGAFWPIYNEFQSKLYEVDTKRFNQIKDFADNYENMSSDKATELIKSVFATDIERIKVERSFMKKFAKVIGPQKTLRYFQAENKIETLVNAQLSSEIPLLETMDY